MSKPRDITGQSFNCLTAIRRVENNCRGKARWLFSCSCGNEHVALMSNVINGNSMSCGCLSSRGNKTHGLNGTRLFNIYRKMIARCYNPRHKHFDRYGGRGIAVCDEWKLDRCAFFDWALHNGYSDDLSIDRLDNNNGYSPSNCQWKTKREQQNNRNNTIVITINGETKPLTNWATQYGIKPTTLRQRIYAGYSAIDALTSKNIGGRTDGRKQSKVC